VLQCVLRCVLQCVAVCFAVCFAMCVAVCCSLYLDQLEVDLIEAADNVQVCCSVFCCVC